MAIIFICGVFFYLFNELEDECVRSTWNTKYEKLNSWLNQKTSWTNKYKEGLLPYKFKWYHFGIYPKYEEKFVYSSTLFVWTTDGEHFFQLLKIISIIIGICVVNIMSGVHFLIGVLTFSYIKEAFLKNID
jgi:hypothetical protein